jgi:hypothetical protein
MRRRHPPLDDKRLIPAAVPVAAPVGSKGNPGASRDFFALPLARGSELANVLALRKGDCAQCEAGKQNTAEQQADPPCGLCVFHATLPVEDPVEKEPFA